MAHYLLLYDLAPDYLDRRGQYRVEHLALVQGAEQRGEIVLAGALADPADMAVLVFAGDGPEGARAFAQADPYVAHGLVTGWRVRAWTTVAGKQAASRPPPA